MVTSYTANEMRAASVMIVYIFMPQWRNGLRPGDLQHSGRRLFGPSAQ